ncbi:hypothetical protein GIB67_004851 [Kingdonia uniflora]|uniref:Kinesin-like protein n=1 Tax=Kingdonia uniflora TaxID=39325 RepID=A0A7J7LNQ5_9MAGN|nr:hypothetical protein GIB67_004851 [Kingdonia uniflora]
MDASWTKNNIPEGTGFTIKSHTDVFLCAGFDSARAEDPEEAEAISVIRGIEAAYNLGLARVLLLTDCQRLFIFPLFTCCFDCASMERNRGDLNASFYSNMIGDFEKLKRLKLRNNNWNSESFKFEEVFNENASQRRVHDGVAKPVVEGVLNGYNGTVMAYGQTGPGKTYTVGQLGKDDISQRGMMVRAMEDIFKNTSSTFDTVEFSYLQLYLEHIQDLLVPENNSILIVEDSKTATFSATIKSSSNSVAVRWIGSASSGSNSNSVAVLQVNVVVPTLRKSKLLIVNLAGSERIDKSGREGHMLEEAKFINLSLTSLGKCINALAVNSPHMPTRDSKLTRLLCDSFGGAEKSLSASSELLEKENSRLELEIKNLVDELNDQKYHNDLMRGEVLRMKMSLKQKKQNQHENFTYQNLLADTTQMYENKIAEMIEQLEDERARSRSAHKQLAVAKQTLIDHHMSIQVQVQNDIHELAMKLKEMCQLHEKTVNAYESLKTEYEKLLS